MANTPRTSGVFNLGALGGDGAASGDANWSDVSLLIRGDTLTELSNNHTLTNNGATAGAAASKYAAGSLLFDGNDYIDVTASNLPVPADGGFTIEAWLKWANTTSGTMTVAAYGDNASNQANGLRTKSTNDGYGAYFWAADLETGDITTGSNAVTLTDWHHVAVTFDGTTRTIWVNGVSRASDTPTWTLSVNDNLSIGVRNADLSGPAHYWNGNIEDLRITKGVARYTGTFTPPTASLPQGAAVASTRPTRRWGGMTGRSLVTGSNVPTTGVLSLPELLQERYGVAAAPWDGTGAELLLVAGGGGGGGVGTTTSIGGGGGGAGAYYPLSSQTFALDGTSYTFTIGAGGAGNTGTGAGSNGGNTTLTGGSYNLSTLGGGGGGAYGSGSSNGANGGSGGGAGWNSTGGSSTAPAGQFGNDGGTTTGLSKAGGGGGAGSAGAISPNNYDGADGGSGKTWPIDSVALAGGGGAGGWQGQGTGYIGQGQDGGADGDGGTATANTGGGGGGGRRAGTSPAGTDGASGVIKLWIPFANYAGYTAGTPANVTSSAVTYSGTAGTLLTVTGTTTLSFS